MSGNLEGRVAIVTGGGRGLGAAYALALAAAGAKVVVNDLGRGLQGDIEGSDPAEELVQQIRAAGGEAVCDRGDVADYDDAGRLIRTAVDRFGGLDILINNAGILRDRMLISMSPDEWDAVIRVHLRGHFCTTQHAVAYWRERAKSAPGGVPGDAALIHTSSIAGLHGNAGQTNYAVAKTGIAMMAWLNHLELNQRYGVRAYAIAPGARTRLTLNSPGAQDTVGKPEDGSFDYYDPANVATFIVWLGQVGCPAPSGGIYGVEGDVVRRYNGWSIGSTIRNDSRPWTLEQLDARAAELAAGSERSFVPITDVIHRG